MNKSSSPTTARLAIINRGDWLSQANQQLRLKSDTATPQLDAELILAYVLDVKRIDLHTHPEVILTEDEHKRANQMLQKRIANYPLAYLTGHKEFFGRDFIVSPDVLIPRPETEELIQQILDIIIPIINAHPIKIADIGCGSGAIGLSLALELERLKAPYKIDLYDISKKALKICKQNQSNLEVLNTKIIQNDLLVNITKNYDVITANLPYVSTDWEINTEAKFEPGSALFADGGGLNLIYRLINQIMEQHNLNPKDWLVLESDPRQQAQLFKRLQKYGFSQIKHAGYVTAAQYRG